MNNVLEAALVVGTFAAVYGIGGAGCSGSGGPGDRAPGPARRLNTHGI
jgi:hypothetical protein